MQTVNLVGCYALRPSPPSPPLPLFIYGKASDSVYMVQAISAEGVPHFIKLYDLKDMMDWKFYASQELVEKALARNGFHCRIKPIKKPQDGELI